MLRLETCGHQIAPRQLARTLRTRKNLHDLVPFLLTLRHDDMITWNFAVADYWRYSGFSELLHILVGAKFAVSFIINCSCFDWFQKDVKYVNLETVYMSSSIHPFSTRSTQASVEKKILIWFAFAHSTKI